MSRDWEGPRRRKPPKEKSSRPHGPVVGASVVMFLVVPAVLVVAFGWFLADGYGLLWF